MQGYVVAGIARIQNGQLYGYLTSDQKCRFSVFIGEHKAPGIALGRGKNEMVVKFIPKWHKLKEGDKVVTSGLDGIFFENVPVGIVSKVEVQSSYAVAHIKTYSDVFHPKTFFLINNAKATLAEGFDSNVTKLEPVVAAGKRSEEQNLSSLKEEIGLKELNASTERVSSIPRRIDQTQEEVIEPESPAEVPEVAKKIQNNAVKPARPKPDISSFDLF